MNESVLSKNPKSTTAPGGTLFVSLDTDPVFRDGKVRKVRLRITRNNTERTKNRTHRSFSDCPYATEEPGWSRNAQENSCIDGYFFAPCARIQNLSALLIVGCFGLGAMRVKRFDESLSNNLRRASFQVTAFEKLDEFTILQKPNRW